MTCNEKEQEAIDEANTKIDSEDKAEDEPYLF